MMMVRHEIIGLMAESKLAGMRHAYDEVRRHPQASAPRPARRWRPAEG